MNHLFLDPQRATHDLAQVLSMAADLYEQRGKMDPMSLPVPPLDFAERVVKLIASGHLPASALELTAGLNGLIRAKDWAMIPYWNAAWQLAPADALPVRPFPTMADVLGDPDGPQQHAGEPKQPESQDSRLIGIAMAEARAIHDGRVVQRHRPPARAAVDCAATFRAVAPIGAGGTMREEMAEARPMLWYSRGQGPHWDALLGAFDAVGAASHEGVERVSRVAQDNPGLPSVQWLAHVTGLASGRGDYEQSMQRMLLALAEFNPLSGALLTCLDMYKCFADEHESQIQTMWLRHASMRRPAKGDVGQDEMEAAAREAARDGNPAAGVLKRLVEMERSQREWERAFSEFHGPFYDLGGPAPEDYRVHTELVHWTTMVFREVLGLELLGRAMSAVRAAVCD